MLDRIIHRASDQALDWLFQIGFAAIGSFGGGGTSSVPGPHRAGGGPVQAGVSYRINEGAHDEYFVPKVGGTILNRQQMREVFGGGSNNNGPVVNNYYIDSNDPSAVYGAILQAKAESIAESEAVINRNLARPSITRERARRAVR